MGSLICILALILLAATPARATTYGPEPPHAPSVERFGPDSLRVAKESERTLRFYDSLQTKTDRRKVPRLLYKMLFVQPSLDTIAQGAIIDENKLLAPYAGKRINEICIDRQQVFAPNGNWIERTGNKLHAMTRERVIRRDLLFKPGDKFDPQLLVRNKQLLRSRAYLSDIDIRILPDSLDSTCVNLIIRTRDRWSISVDGALRSEGRTMIGLYDVNILGSGNMLKFKTNISREDFSYGGNMVEYRIPNLLGSFYMADFSAGRDFYNNELSFSIRKEFIKRTDYEAGASYSNIQSKRGLPGSDTTFLIKVRNIDAWGGRSYYLRGINSSIYLTGRYSYQRYSLRPEIGPKLHPAMHNYDNLLMGLGLYREKFYTANMVYGFGTKEYLATGYKAEVVSGHSWGEFNNEMYLGLTYKTGGFYNVGYLMGNFTLGSYIDRKTGTWRHCAVDVEVKWFSNLHLVRRTRIRQFLTLQYTQGWSRAAGADESIGFTKLSGLQGLKAVPIGTNRTVLNSETVVFTPWQPLGFRIAFFGFADFGLIGYHANTFRNSFFTTLGAGIRIKNERLVFSTIQIRFGVALGKYGLVDCEYFEVSNGRELEQYRYRPTRPEIVGFR